MGELAAVLPYLGRRCLRLSPVQLATEMGVEAVKHHPSALSTFMFEVRGD
jgi:hypothetical protein